MEDAGDCSGKGKGGSEGGECDAALQWDIFVWGLSVGRLCK